MDELEEINHRLVFSNLLARMELLEIERASLLREVSSPWTSQDRREEAMLRRFDLADECDEIAGKLKRMGDPRASNRPLLHAVQDV